MKIKPTDIEKMELLLIEAIKKSDIEFLDRILHNDLLGMAPNGQTITKKVDLASHKAGEMLVQELLPTLEDIKIIGDNAVTTVIYDTKGVMLGKPVQGRFKYIRVWKKLDDGIKIIAASCFKLD